MLGEPKLDLENSSHTSDSGLEISSGSLCNNSIESPRLQSTRPYVVCVEGNIGCGKTTLMQHFQNSEGADAISEPIHKWTNLKGHNALEKLYQDANRWTFSFNTYAALTRCQMHETPTDRPVLLLERSLYSLRYCFVESAHLSGTLHGMEYGIMCRWFDYLRSQDHIPIDLFVYLRADPQKCYERLRRRDRKEEVCVPYSLIEDLHKVHEDWLIEEKHPLPAPVIVLDANVDMPDMQSVYDEYRSRILFGHT